MAQLQKYKEDSILFVEGGFIAASMADEDAALKLFRASQLLEPENELVKIGFGYIHLLKLELKQASDQFEGVLKKNPKNEMARALLGLSIAFTTKDADKGEKLLEEARKNSDDAQVKTMAATGIDFINKFIRKAPTPAQGATEGKKKKGKKE
jgi:tetratricopeptide (TPR) repeat protein